jgi:uncharacterized protein with GYD domain
MPYYMIQAAYTPDTWGKLLKKPTDRTQVVKPAIEKLGGKVSSAWLAFGDYDVVAIIQMPDNITAAAIAMSFAAGGAVKALKTTPLLTWSEGIKAMRKATKSGYRPPK